ncbi:ArsR/SmtB family transcription factor [Pseudactinotalea terrae]|uniref:ArsR/SmtB family transcription factor n=1 Tax=Pseudactinotalea terrae TaxID=1743262 RepID=UPI0019D51CA5|nr:winged helix-turn-helix domain-containing protein [Pseudactinotalea terrae]
MADDDERGDVVPPTPDYELAETLELTDPGQYRALFEDTRKEIVSLLLERAATTSELAEVLGKPKGTVGHHLKVLADAGLVHVVRTKRVRALEAKYYGRTARVFLYQREHEAVGEEERVLAQAAAAIAQMPDGMVSANARYARIPEERAQEWRHRLDQLLLEFAAEPPGGETTFAFVYGLYATSRPPLPRDEQ